MAARTRAMNMCDPDQRCTRESSVLIGGTSAAFRTPARDCTSKASDITRRSPRLSAACFVHKEEFLAS
jgi:hypothetical protein